MVQHKILILAEEEPSVIVKHVVTRFNTETVNAFSRVPERLAEANYKALLFDMASLARVDLDRVKSLMKMECVVDLPVLLLGKQGAVDDKLEAYDLGCDDFIDPATSPDEVCARITKSIFNRVATEQLTSRLAEAHQTAHSAMADNSDLGANIRFLINIHHCDNLDQLGQLFFGAIQRYGLRCSLQLRSLYEIKDMEAHGMAKDLEAQLLTQLKDSGRYIDYGSRTIINYDRVSLLIKNMPVQNPERYGAIKDNTFALIQGVNARVVALEASLRLSEERETLRKMASDVRRVMKSLKDSYHGVMTDIATQADNASERIMMKLPSLALTENDERYIESTMDSLITSTSAIFNEGLKVDHVMQRVEVTLQRALDSVDEKRVDSRLSASNEVVGTSSGSEIELF